MKLNFSDSSYKEKAAYILSNDTVPSDITPEDAFILLIKGVEFNELENLCMEISSSININIDDSYKLTQNPITDYDKRVVFESALKLVVEKEYMGNKLVPGTSINTSGWISHCLNSAVLAYVLANEMNLDSEYAFCYGLLHDYGRKFSHDFTHVVKGFEALSSIGYDDLAKGCLTHSFINGGRNCNNEVVNDSFYVDEEGKEHYDENDDMCEVLESSNYSDYDFILNIVDLMAADSKIMSPVDRIADIATRRPGIDNSSNRKYFYTSLYNLLIDYLSKLRNINIDEYNHLDYTSVSLDEVKEKIVKISNIIYNIQSEAEISTINYLINENHSINNSLDDIQKKR